MKKPYFPLFVDLSEKKVYVIGAGTIAKRRIRSLTDFTDHLIVVGTGGESGTERTGTGRKELPSSEKNLNFRILPEADIVIAATNDHSLNGEIYDYCIEQEILVNVCNDKKKCDFYFPGLAMKDNVVVGVTANGTNHKMARKAVEKIREMLEEWL